MSHLDKLDYWIESISEGAADDNIPLTDDQIKSLAKTAQIAHECIHMYYHDPSFEMNKGENPEIKRLKEELAKEKAKRFCEKCNGKGWIKEYIGGTLCAQGSCSHCRGEGKI